MLIVHIAKKKEWEKALKSGKYAPKSLNVVGFIHCSAPKQAIGVANDNFKGKRSLILICINSSKVRADIRFEKGGDDYYPHIYGALNCDAVVKTYEFEPNLDGNFTLPKDIDKLSKSLE